jgi:translation initiation factor IF-1
MQKKELIVLDAQLADVIDDGVFSAELDNGHRFIAVAKGPECRSQEPLKPQERVTVAFSPFDMSKGQVMGRVRFARGQLSRPPAGMPFGAGGTKETD